MAQITIEHLGPNATVADLASYEEVVDSIDAICDDTTRESADRAVWNDGSWYESIHGYAVEKARGADHARLARDDNSADPYNPPARQQLAAWAGYHVGWESVIPR